MDQERVTERTDGVTNERTVERTHDGGTTVVERRGGASGLLIGLGILLLVVIVGWFLINANRNDAIETAAVSDAAESVASSAAGAADAVADSAATVAGDAGQAVENAGEAAAPAQ